MPTPKRSRKSAVAKIPATMRTATELDMLAAVATSVHLENEQAENSSKPKRSTKSKKQREEDLAVEQIMDDLDSPTLQIQTNPLGPKPKTMEMTQNLIDSLMAPVKVRPSLATDEVFITIPLDQTDEPDYFKATFTGGVKLKIVGYDEEYPIKNVDGYIQCYDESHADDDSCRRKQKKLPRSFNCDENFTEIDSELRLQSWLDKVEHGQWTILLREHDYFQQFVKFGRPESTTYIDAAIAAYNKYKNFVSLSCPTLNSPNYLFGLWWEKEEPAVDFWLLPKPIDQPDNVYQGLPENHWSGNVVVAREELIDVDMEEGKVVPFFDLLDTPVDTRRFEQQISWEETKKSFQNQKYDDEHAKASRAIQPKKSENVSLGPSTSLKPIRKALGRPLAGQFRTVHMQRSTDMVGSYETVEQEDDDDDIPDDADVVHQSNPLRMQVPNGTTDGRNRKLLSREKVEEMDFAMRCIKEIQHHRYRGYYPLRCKICQREFTAPTSLIVHYRSHAGIKPFTCSVCLASFTRRHSLKYHMLCHSGQARFRCDICQRLFRHSGHFRDHMRKHELGTPFACDLCGSEFGTRTSYRRHMLLTHEQTPNSNQNKKVQNHSQASTSGNQIVDESYAAVHNLMKKPNRTRHTYDEANDVLVEELVEHEMDIETSVNVVPGLLVIPNSSGSSQTLVVQQSGEVRVANSWALMNSKNVSPSKIPISRVKQEKSPISVGQTSNDPTSSSYSFNKMMVSSSKRS